MKVNLEVKGTLAKLLATEDLIVERRKVSTASFNVQTRVLTLPTWDRATSTVIDLLISHEVGHALFTPADDWDFDCPQSFVNVTEDVRIENKMKRKYPGIPKIFFNGYKELFKDDFFGIAEVDIDSLNIADRVNLYFKIGNHVKISFSEEEKDLIRQINAAETFDDAKRAAERMYQMHNEKQEEEKEKEEVEASSSEEESDQQTQDGESNGEESSDQTEGSQEGDSDDGDPVESDEKVETPVSSSGGAHNDDEVSTMDSLQDKLEEMTSSYGNDPVYVEYPEVDLDKIIIPCSEVNDYIKMVWDRAIAKSEDDWISKILDTQAESFRHFKREIQSEVNYMVKEFECKKSAAAYARAATSRTGVLDCTKLHTYKYNEDLFKKVTTLPNGKNHGLIFILDWSGSMSNILLDTVKQLISLVMFCDKVNIPFDVYAFTNEWEQTTPYCKNEELEKAGELFLGDYFRLLNMISSSDKNLVDQMQNLYMIARMYSSYEYNLVPSKVSLSGTPLNEALVALNKIIPTFKSKHNVEKVHSMILTDGEGSPIGYTVPAYNDPDSFLVRKLYGETCYLRNRKTGTVRHFGTEKPVTEIILEDLRHTHKGSTITGFRLLERGSSQWYVREAIKGDTKKENQWRKEKTVCITNRGYDKYFILASNKLHEDVKMEVKENATKAQIKTAFSKSMKSKQNNKKILGEFIGMIA